MKVMHVKKMNDSDRIVSEVIEVDNMGSNALLAHLGIKKLHEMDVIERGHHGENQTVTILRSCAKAWTHDEHLFIKM